MRGFTVKNYFQTVKTNVMRKIFLTFFDAIIFLCSNAQMVSMSGGGVETKTGKSKKEGYRMSPQKKIL